MRAYYFEKRVYINGDSEKFNYMFNVYKFKLLIINADSDTFMIRYIL